MLAPLKKKTVVPRVLVHTGRVLGYVVLFVLFLVVGALLHLDVPVARRVAAKQLSDSLATLFAGKIVLEHVDGLGVSGVSGADAYVTAPDGTRVIVAHGVRAKVAPMALVRTLLAGKGVIAIYDIEVDDVEVVLDEDPKGGLKIAAAFADASPQAPKPQDDKPAAYHVDLSSAHVKHAWVHGRITGAPIIDADANDVRASVHVADTVRVDVSHADLETRAMPQHANAKGVVSKGWVALPSPMKRDVGFGARFDGLLGLVPAHANVDMDGPEWHFVVDVPQVDAEKVRTMVPEAPLYGPLTVHAEANGPLDTLLISANVGVGPGKVDAKGRLALADGVHVSAHVDASDVDVRNFSPGAPASRLGTQTDVELSAPTGQPMRGTFTLTTPEGMISGQPLPATQLHGSFAQSAGPKAAGDPGITATAAGKVLEPGAPTDITVTLRKGPTLDVHAHTVVPSLAGVKRAGFIGAGQADVTTTGSLQLAGTPRFDANVRAVVNGFHRDQVRVAHATVVGHAAGTFDAPGFEATLDANDVSAERFSWNHFSATASGSPASIGVTVSAHGVETPSIEGHATVATGNITTITDADLTLRRRTTAMHARVGRVRVGPQLLTVEDAEMTGMGEPLHASFSSQGSVLTVQAQSDGLNLHDAAYLFRVDDRLKQGTAAVALNVRTTRTEAEGTAKVSVTGVQWGDDYQAVAASVDATLHGRVITGSGSVRMPRLGEVHLTYATIHVGGSGPLTEASWRSSWGDVALDGHVNIASAAALLPPGTLPKMTLGGMVEIKAHTSRASATDDAPVIALSLQTHQLYAASLPQWELRGFDAAVDMNVKGGSGALTVDASDALGKLVSVDARSTHLPYGELFGDDPVTAVMRQPMTAHVHVPPRELDTLPLIIRPKGVHGFVQLDVSATGTALAPVITLDGAARGTTFTDAPNVKPLDVATHGTYAAKVGDLTLDVSDAHEVFVHTAAHANADLGLFVRGKDDPAWTGNVHSTLLHFPLGAITQLSDRNIRGRISGELELTRYHDDARASASLVADRLAIGRTRFTNASVEAKYDGQNLDTHVRLDAKDGFAEATAKMAMVWGRALAPKPAPMTGLAATMTAKNLQAAFLEPLLSSSVDELDGVLDGDASLKLALGEPPSMSGNLTLHDGRVIPSATGEELHGIGAKVTLAQDGTLSLTDLVALGTSGKVTGSGAAHLAGLSLADASVQLSIAKKDALPLALGGSVLGTGYGIITLGAKSSGSNTKVTIDIPTFHVDLPEATPRAVQDLDPPPDNIHVGVVLRDGQLKPLGKTRNDINQRKPGTTPSTLEVAVHLGLVDVNRGSDLRAALSGDTTLMVADKTTMRGQIIIKNGTLAVQGKPFEVQKGTATFVGDPQNPEIDLTASWKASDGTEVFADYLGPLKTGKVVLRSEPPRPQNEIVSLILFGTADGAQSTPYAQQQTTDTTTQVGTAVGGFATGGLNKGIDKLTGMDISTKIDTSQANPRPEVELRIARDLSLQIAFVLGTPPPGTNQDTTYATIDWRFYRNWSLATTFGNMGSSMADVLWRYRY